MALSQKIRRLLAVTALLLAALLCTGCLSRAIYTVLADKYDNGNIDHSPTEEPADPALLDFVVADSTEDLVPDTYEGGDEYSRYVTIYDFTYLPLAFGTERVTAADLIAVVEANENIPARFKALLYTYITRISERYPTVNLRVLYENLLTLRVLESTEDELRIASLSFDSYGCYIASKNAIYVLNDILPEPGTWDYQVLFHEFTHALRGGRFKQGEDEKTILIRSGGNALDLLTTDEALTSLFAVSLFDYEERDVAYQLQSNLYDIIIDCCDNYTLADAVNHSQSYLAKQLDLQNGHHNYAVSILKLIHAQYEDYHDDSYTREQQVYYPTYDYIAEMYYQKNVLPGMTQAEATAAADALVERVMFDVPEAYGIDTAEFYRYLDQYCAKNSIFSRAAEATPAPEAALAPAA